MYITKFQVNSYETIDDGWGAAYMSPIEQAGPDHIIFSGRTELGKYFPTKDEANIYTVNYLKQALGVSDDAIEIITV